MHNIVRKGKTFPRIVLDLLPLTFLVVIIPLTYWYEIWVVLPGLFCITENTKMYILLFTIGHFLLMNILGNLVGIIVTDTSIRGRIMPSMESSLAHGYCEVCASVTPFRAFHCPSCNTCILRRDHHCAFTACCIGHYNYRFFLLFLFYMFISTALCLPFNMIFIWDACTWINATAIAKVIFPALMVFYGCSFTLEQYYLIISVISMSGMLLIGLWFYYHLKLALSGRVVHELRHNITLYDRGYVENLKEILGERWHLVWLSPFLKSHLIHDGITFTTKNHAS